MSAGQTNPTQESPPEPDFRPTGSEVLGSSASEWQAEASTPVDTSAGETGAPPSGRRTSLRLYNGLLLALALVLILALATLLYLLFIPSVAPPAPPITPTPAATPVRDAVWEAIQASGQVRAAVSADLPPFAFLNADLEPAGFDAALLQEVAGRMEVALRLQDLASPGLPAALQVGQVELAAAALAPDQPTPPGTAVSLPYYTNVDAYLARREAGLAVQAVSDLAQQRMGVVLPSSFARWVQTELVPAGQIPAENVFLYTGSDPAVADLLQGRLDILLLDEAAAGSYLVDGELMLAGSGLHAQQHVLLLPPDAPLLAAQVNDALVAMQADGTLAGLAEQYLGVPAGIPSPAGNDLPIRPPAAADTAACLDAMEWLAAEPSAEPPVRLPGERFIQSWRVRNTGTCTWDGSYRLVAAPGELLAPVMASIPAALQKPVPPGVTVEWRVPLTAPLAPGLYRGVWQLQNPAGTAFGAHLPAGAAVSSNGADPASSPPAIQRFTPLALARAPETLGLPAGTYDLPPGMCTRLHWQVRSGSARVELLRNELPVWNDAPLQGVYQDCPQDLGGYAYRLVAAAAGGTSQQETRIELRLEAPAPPTPPLPPEILSFNAGPGPLTPGMCAPLSWQVSGMADRIRILRDGALAFDDLPAVGSGQDCFHTRTSSTYTLEASGAGGMASAAAQVSVLLEGSYLLQQLQGPEGALVSLLPGSTITLALSPDRLSGVGGCNEFGGAYTLTDDTMTIGVLDVTTRLCPPPALMRQETRFLELLSAANRLHLLGSRLELVLQRTDPATGQEVQDVLLVLAPAAP